jgi:ABC-type phosphonate transport system ATPase subunit
MQDIETGEISVLMTELRGCLADMAKWVKPEDGQLTYDHTAICCAVEILAEIVRRVAIRTEWLAEDIQG